MQRPRPTARYLLALAAACYALPALADYETTVLSDSPKAFYRFNDAIQRGTVEANLGSAGAAANGTNDLGRVVPFAGAIKGDADRAAFYNTQNRTLIPFTQALNPPNTQPFTVEAWFYPANDVTSNGQSPLNNRTAYSGVNRQGWVMFQRKPNADYAGGEKVGWNFRMFNENGSTTALDVTSLVDYQIGKWTHMVVVYDPQQLTNAKLTMYIDGVEANTATWGGPGPGYVANTDTHSPNAPAGLSIGQYNNTSSPNSNPFFGGVDEFAFYPTKLTPEQILAHYQNGTNANRTISYSELVKSHGPSVYLRLSDASEGPDVALNFGTTQAGGTATHTADIEHKAGALVARAEDGSAGYHTRNNGKVTTTIPYLAANNPNAGIPFTFETWLKPMRDNQGGQCPVNNRMVGGTGRTGWVIFQRNPNATYNSLPGSEGHGWNFRMYKGDGTGGQDILTDTDYQVGKWQHLVVTWVPTAQNGDVAGNGNDQWVGTLTAYVDGVSVKTNENILYAANTEVTETGVAPADLGIGSYNAASGIGGNPFEGQIDELAIYNNIVLTPEQVLAHYQAGTNALSATNYETLVFTAGFTGPEKVGLPATYLRFAEGAPYQAVNKGAAGASATASLVNVKNDASGPSTSGFGAGNRAVDLTTAKTFVSLNNPSGLNTSNQITLEAWIKPGATQGDVARIISHGPPTQTAFDIEANPTLDLQGSLTSSNEVFLRIDNAGTTYSVGASDGFETWGVSYPVGSDVGSGQWIHLAGVYDGTNWRLYRNGVLATNAPSAKGALTVAGADWAIGSTGNGWEQNFVGAIDEVAIYSQALSGAQVAAHYAAATQATSTVKLTVTQTNGMVQITWPSGTLQQADDPSGNWSDVQNASSPFEVTPSAAKKFYRSKL